MARSSVAPAAEGPLTYTIVNEALGPVKYTSTYCGGVIPNNGEFEMLLAPKSTRSYTLGIELGSGYCQRLTVATSGARFLEEMTMLVMGRTVDSMPGGTYHLISTPVPPADEKCPADLASYEGRRVRLPGTPAVYLVMACKRRLVPNSSTYSDLFDDWHSIADTSDASKIPLGDPISDGASLVRHGACAICPGGCAKDPKVYLNSNNVHRHIVSPAVFIRHGFSMARVREHCGPYTAGPNIE